MDTTTAKDRALAVPELLENILLHLPPKDLLLAQRVSKTWLESIKASIEIQRKLFFAAAPESEEAVDEEPNINPFFDRIIRLIDSDAAMYPNDAFCIFVEIPYCPVDLAKAKYRGSWRNMFIANPPFPVKLIVHDVLSDEGYSFAGWPLTMGEIADHITRS